MSWRRSAKKDQEDISNKLSRDYVTGVNFLLSNQTDKAVGLLDYKSQILGQFFLPHVEQ